MSHNIRILVLPCGSGVSIEIHRSLCFEKNIDLIGASSVNDHGRYLYKNYIGDFPHVFSDNFLIELDRVVDENNIDFIYPGHDDVCLKLANRDDVIGSPFSTNEICISKLKTYSLLNERIEVPEVYDANHPKFPAFLKPDRGQGSKGVMLVNNKNELDLFLDKDNTLLILEYLPGEEFTVDCFTDRNRELKFVGARKRERVVNGISVKTTRFFDEKIIDIAHKINDALELRGAWFFQLKKNSLDNYSLLEIAPRVSGGMSLYRNAGVNFPLLSVYDKMGIDVDIQCYDDVWPIEMDRYWHNKFNVIFEVEYDVVYLDCDDTLILKNEVNPVLMAFIWQCRNRNIDVYLLTKHDGDVSDYLNQFGISKDLFVRIIHIPSKDEKVDYIKRDKAIFIDDSFSERNKVYKTHGIISFGLDSVDSLLDWRR